MAIPILAVPEKHWYCPNCTEVSVTREPLPHTRMHVCRGLRGLTAPMVEVGLSAKVEAVERGDYTNGDEVTYDPEGRAIMSVVVTRDEGTDVAVFAPVATATSER